VKIQIINLDPNDDALSVRDKMSWSQTGRILLVYPVHGCMLNRQLDLNLVKRQVISMGAQLALVTRDSEVRFYARKIGIPVFNNLQRALDHPWKIIRQAQINHHQNSRPYNFEDIRKNILPAVPAWTEHPVIRFFCLGISVLALSILGVFILPSARITLSPKIEIQSMRFDLSADPASTIINYSTGRIPSSNQEVIVEGGDTITATGTVNIADDPALSSLKFTNESKLVIYIPPETIITTLGKDPVRFITTQSGDVAVFPTESVAVPARAIKPGRSGNLSPNKLVVIDGDLGQGLKVTNPKATQGGTDASVPSPTTQDLEELRSRLHSQLTQVALAQFQSVLPKGDTLISPTMAMVEVLEETTSPSVGEPGTKLELTTRLRFRSQVVAGEAIHSLVIPILDSNTPSGYSPLSNSLEITQLSNPSLAQDGSAHWTISVMRKLKVDIQDYQAINIVKGATISKAKEYLSSDLPLMAEAQIVLAPSWWPRLPLVPMRIQVFQAEVP
jgi:hypothetical protein